MAVGVWRPAVRAALPKNRISPRGRPPIRATRELEGIGAMTCDRLVPDPLDERMPPSRRGWAAVFVLAAASAAAGMAYAQTPPDAGALQQQIERERKLPLPPRSVPEKPAAPPAMKPAAVSVVVKEFRFAGNTLLGDAQLAAAVAPYLNRSLDFAQLQEAVAAVARAYRDAGWIVRAYLPAQDITEGAVVIQIVEAVFGRLHLEGGPGRVAPERLATLVARQQAAGEPLNADALDRALLLADDLPGVVVTGQLRQGAAERETDLVLAQAAEPLVSGEAVVDNGGARSTGAERLGITLGLASPLGKGDRFAAQVIHSRGSDYVRLTASQPVGADGWRAGANLSYLAYELVGTEFAALDAEGTVRGAGLDASYPLIRSRLKNLYASFAYDRKRFHNKALGVATSRYETETIGAMLNGNAFDRMGGGGANALGLTLTLGDLDLDGSPNQAVDAVTTRTAGRYAKLRYALSRQQVLAPALSLLVAVSGQEASRNLDSSEKFYLGGSYGVRAYPVNEGGGAEGQLVNVELRWRLSEGLTVTGFYDWGRVVQNAFNDYPASADPNAYVLKGYGVSLGWQALLGLDFQAVWARRDGDNPNPTATGRDQDGSLHRNQWWLLAGLSF